VNTEFHYPHYLSITPTGGPKPKVSFAEGFFAVAEEQNPKPQALAVVGADAELPGMLWTGRTHRPSQFDPSCPGYEARFAVERIRSRVVHWQNALLLPMHRDKEQMSASEERQNKKGELHHANCSRSAFASFRSEVSNPSVNRR
jgi:hypothetical protein